MTRRGDERAPYSANGATWYPVAEGRLSTRVLTLFGILWAPDDPNQVISRRFRLASVSHGSMGMAAILVVDDDADLRSLAQIILEQSGYQVLVAADGPQALQIAQQDSDPIDLLLTDLVMPGMDGAALGRQLRLLRPAMRILYMTALAVAQLAGQEIVLKHIRLDPDVPILVKPFSVEAFQQKVREVLDPAPGHSLAPDPPAQLRPVS